MPQTTNTLRREKIVQPVIYVLSDNLYPLKTVRRKWTQLKDLPNPGMQGITFASVPTRDAHVQSCEMHRFKKSGYKHNLRHFIRPTYNRTADLNMDMAMLMEMVFLLSYRIILNYKRKRTALWGQMKTKTESRRLGQNECGNIIWGLGPALAIRIHILVAVSHMEAIFPEGSKITIWMQRTRVAISASN